MATFYNDGSRIPAAPYKDPDSVIDYGCGYLGWLAIDEVIDSSIWLVNGTIISAPQTVDSLTVDAATNDSTSSTVWLSGGTVGTTYTLTNRISTSAGRTEDRSMTIYCAEK